MNSDLTPLSIWATILSVFITCQSFCLLSMIVNLFMVFDLSLDGFDRRLKPICVSFSNIILMISSKKVIHFVRTCPTPVRTSPRFIWGLMLNKKPHPEPVHRFTEKYKPLKRLQLQEVCLLLNTILKNGDELTKLLHRMQIGLNRNKIVC